MQRIKYKVKNQTLTYRLGEITFDANGCADLETPEQIEFWSQMPGVHFIPVEEPVEEPEPVEETPPTQYEEDDQNVPVEEPVEDTPLPVVDLTKWTVKDLRQLAQNLNIEIPADAHKDDIVALIKEAHDKGRPQE